LDFAKEQIPEFIQQLIRWQIGTNIFKLIVCIILLTLAIWLGVKYFSIIIKKWYEFDEIHIAFLVSWILGTVFMGIMSFIYIICNTSNLLKLWLAPKVFLIEYLSNIITGGLK
jgi:TRAP-type C4-dicarboxylate transport system permease small subunit